MYYLTPSRVLKICCSSVYTYYRTEKGHAFYRTTQGMATITKGTLCGIQSGMQRKINKYRFSIFSQAFDLTKCFIDHEGIWPWNDIWIKDRRPDREYSCFSSTNSSMGIWSCILSAILFLKKNYFHFFLSAFESDWLCYHAATGRRKWRMETSRCMHQSKRMAFTVNKLECIVSVGAVHFLFCS